VVSALVPYKRLELAIAAARQLGARLKIVGEGPERTPLEALGGPGIEFLGALDGEALREAYRGAQALVLPGEEDFGIAPVEAMACGRPVVALARGGALETVVPRVTGLLVDDPAPDKFAEAMRAVPAAGFQPADARQRAEMFSTERFESGFRAFVTEALAGHTC
jgi:glycosyltransferase involved in cell wall biosynthesis